MTSRHLKKVSKKKRKKRERGHTNRDDDPDMGWGSPWGVDYLQKKDKGIIKKNVKISREPGGKERLDDVTRQWNKPSVPAQLDFNGKDNQIVDRANDCFA